MRAMLPLLILAACSRGPDHTATGRPTSTACLSGKAPEGTLLEIDGAPLAAVGPDERYELCGLAPGPHVVFVGSGDVEQELKVTLAPGARRVLDLCRSSDVVHSRTVGWGDGTPQEYRAGTSHALRRCP